MLKAHGLEYEASGRGEAVLLSHGGHVADGFLEAAPAREPGDGAQGAVAAGDDNPF